MAHLGFRVESPLVDGSALRIILLPLLGIVAGRQPIDILIGF
jgi:hypothetical protein